MVAAISSPGAVLQVSLYRGCCPSSVRRPSLAFHIFDISSRFISWIELKLSVCVWGVGGGGGHCGNTEIQNCEIRFVPISKSAARAAISKFFK